MVLKLEKPKGKEMTMRFPYTLALLHAMRAVRKQEGMSRHQVFEQSGVSERSYWRIVSDAENSTTTLNTIVRIAKALKIPPKELANAVRRDVLFAMKEKSSEDSGVDSGSKS